MSRPQVQYSSCQPANLCKFFCNKITRFNISSNISWIFDIYERHCAKLLFEQVSVKRTPSCLLLPILVTPRFSHWSISQHTGKGSRLAFWSIKWKNLYVSLRLRVQNRRRKWHFPPNFRNSIIWTAPFPLNIRNGIIWGGAFSKAFRSSEAFMSILSKNGRLISATA